MQFAKSQTSRFAKRLGQHSSLTSLTRCHSQTCKIGLLQHFCTHFSTFLRQFIIFTNDSHRPPDCKGMLTTSLQQIGKLKGGNIFFFESQMLSEPHRAVRSVCQLAKQRPTRGQRIQSNQSELPLFLPYKQSSPLTGRENKTTQDKATKP